MSWSKVVFVAASLVCYEWATISNASAASYFLDDAQVTVSGNLGPSGTPFTVDQKWSFAPSTGWAPWNALQPGRGFLMAGTFADSVAGGGVANENTSLNPATIDLSLGNGTYSNVAFLVYSHGFHSTAPPVARVQVTAEGNALGEVAENFATSVDFTIPLGTPPTQQRFNWVSLADSYNVTDGSLTLTFGRTFSANAAWYTIGRIQADFVGVPEPTGIALGMIGIAASVAAGFRRRRA